MKLLHSHTYTSLIMLGFLTACTPAEVILVEEVAHEASVAEEAIENDLKGQSQPVAQPVKVSQVKVKPTYVANARQYPPGRQRNPQRIPNHGY